MEVEEEKEMETQPKKTIPRKEAIANWTQYGLDDSIAEALVANNFLEPTEVQDKSLQLLKFRSDLVIAAKTGQGKTLSFALSILDNIVRGIVREKSPEGRSLRALILSPTRELAK